MRSEGKAREGAPERLPVGGGYYELVSKLGSGGMAEVFIARRRGAHAIEHMVVIKRLREDVRQKPALARIFAWEAWISSRLCHPNIVRFHDFVTHQGRDHLVLEHVRGPDLASIGRMLHAAGRPFPFNAVLEVGIAAARALAHAHGLADDEGRLLGLVHRDVSPQNILVSAEGEIKLIDFGVAKTTSAHVPRDTAPGLVKGKMGYIAPEHLRGQSLDARGDLYALGVVLFEMITGRRLLRRGADPEMIRAALEAEIPSLSALRPDCPQALETLVRRALAQEPHDRFESAEAMERALREVATSLPEDPEAPTLSHLAREAQAALLDGRRAAAHAGPVSGVVEAPRQAEERAEEATRPEGARRRAQGAEGASVEGDANDSARAPITALSPLERGTIEIEPAWRLRLPARALPILIAFVTGALVAAAAVSRVHRTGPATEGPTQAAPAESPTACPTRGAEDAPAP